VLRDRAGTTGNLADLLRHLNRMLAADLEGERFMTMHLSVVDARAATFRWASAGHDAAIVFDPAAAHFAQEKRSQGIPLGIMDDSEYSEETYSPLRPGQVIVIGTDGVWESPNAAGEQFGKPRLREAIRSAAAGTAAEIVAAILEALGKFRGGCPAVDDVTFVVVKIPTVEPPVPVPSG
jgi:sigma-B regulation protein RsbU (phosphoserine phosphatase)